MGACGKNGFRYGPCLLSLLIAINDSLTTTTHRSGSDSEFIFPTEILKEERAQAANLIKSLSPKLAQQILKDGRSITIATGEQIR